MINDTEAEYVQIISSFFECVSFGFSFSTLLRKLFYEYRNHPHVEHLSNFLTEL